jgi:uncharacterized protein with GYD domain
MGRYLWQATYTAEGAKGLLKEGGSSRRKLIEELVTAAGGRLEGFYYAFGDSDVYVIAELPGDADAAAVSLAVGAGGAATIKTTVLLDPETIDEATKRTVAYRVPGA